MRLGSITSGVSWLSVIGNTDHKRRLISNCTGDAKLSIVLFRYSSKLRYGSDWVSLALVSSFFTICTDFSARPLACG